MHLGGRLHLRLRPAQLGRSTRPPASSSRSTRTSPGSAATPPTPRPAAPRGPTRASSTRTWCCRPSSRAARSIVSDDGTRITDRFNTGGDSFRGFARNGLGPRDFCGDDDETACTRAAGQHVEVDDALGGNYYTRAAARRELPARPARGVRHLRRRLRRHRLALGPRRDRRQHGRGRRRRSRALRRSASACSSTRRSRRCASTTRCRSSTRTTTSSSASASRSRPGSEPWLGAARGPGRRGPRRGAGRRAPPRAQEAAAPPFLIINQERILTGSEAGPAAARRGGARARRAAREARALDAAFEAEERRLTEQRPDLDPAEFRRLADEFDARVVAGAARPGRPRRRARAGV